MAKRKANMLFFAVMMAFYVSFINITKSPYNDADLTWYSEGFLDAGKYNLKDYLFLFGINGKGRELFFPLLNYILYSMIGPNVILYRFILSFGTYLCAFWVIIKISDSLRLEQSFTALSISWFVCFPWIFTFSEMLLRQFLAASFLMLIIHFWCYERNLKITMALCVAMVLTHTSSLFFVPFFFIPFFSKPLTGRTALVYAIAVILIVSVQKITGTILASFGGGDNVMTYALARAATNTTFELPPLSIGKIIFLLFIIYILALSLYTQNRKHYYNNNSKYKDGDVLTSNIITISAIFVLVSISQTELSNRFFLYTACLSSIAWLYALKRYRIAKSFVFMIYIMLQTMLVLYYSTSLYLYKIETYIMFNPIKHLL